MFGPFLIEIGGLTIRLVYEKKSIFKAPGLCARERSKRSKIDKDRSGSADPI